MLDSTSHMPDLLTSPTVRAEMPAVKPRLSPRPQVSIIIIPAWNAAGDCGCWQPLRTP